MYEPVPAFFPSVADAGRVGHATLSSPWGRATRNFEALKLSTPIYAMGSRYGLLCFVGARHLHIVPAGREKLISFNQVHPALVALNDECIHYPEYLNHPYALTLDHGHAYILGSSSAMRIDLAHHNIEALKGKFRFQISTPTRWIGVGVDENRQLFVAECAAFSGKFETLQQIPFQGPAPSAIEYNLDKLVDVVAVGERVYFAFQKDLFALDGGKFQLLWSATNESIASLSLYKGDCLVVTQGDSHASVYRLAAGTAPRDKVDIRTTGILARPVVVGDYLYLIDNDNRLIYRYWLQHMGIDPSESSFQALGLVTAAYGVSFEGRHWLLTILRSKDSVLAEARPAFPELESGWRTAEPMSPSQRICLTIIENLLVVAATTDRPTDQAIRTYEMS